VISDDENSENIFKALDYGALSFLTKECDPPEILNALIATSKSEKFICHKIIEVILDKKSKFLLKRRIVKEVSLSFPRN
jgi:two-component system invasion response regulator UvrY